MRAVCVFRGSSPRRGPGYRAAATDLGRVQASRGTGLVYGGAAPQALLDALAAWQPPPVPKWSGTAGGDMAIRHRT